MVDSYEPRLKEVSSQLPKTMVDPLTHRVIPVEQANEHVRIELIDPAWRKQREVRRERDATSNLVDGSALSDSIHRMRADKEAELQGKRPARDADREADEQLKRARMMATGQTEAGSAYDDARDGVCGGGGGSGSVACGGAGNGEAAHEWNEWCEWNEPNEPNESNESNARNARNARYATHADADDADDAGDADDA